MVRFRSTDEAYIRKLTIRVTDAVYETIQVVARSKGMSMNELLSRLICDYLAAQDHDDVDRWLERTGQDHRRRLAAIRRQASV